MTMQWIATANGTGSSTTVQFLNIPQNFTHLQVRAIARGTAASNYDSLFMRFNSDSGNNYVRRYLYGQGSGSAIANGNNAVNSFYSGSSIANGNLTAGLCGVAITDILDYSSINKYKVARVINGVDASGSGYIELDTGIWFNTAAITSITIFANSNFSILSRFDLYGISVSGVTGA